MAPSRYRPTCCTDMEQHQSLAFERVARAVLFVHAPPITMVISFHVVSCGYSTALCSLINDDTIMFQRLFITNTFILPSGIIFWSRRFVYIIFIIAFKTQAHTPKSRCSKNILNKHREGRIYNPRYVIMRHFDVYT